jgi:hypothetical protein
MNAACSALYHAAPVFNFSRVCLATSSALHSIATVFNFSRVYLAASFALYPVAVMLYTFWVAGTTDFALNRGDRLCFFGTCYLALVIFLMYYFFVTSWFVPARRIIFVAFVAFAAASRARLVMLAALWFLALGTGAVANRGLSFVTVIRKSRTCC